MDWDSLLASLREAAVIAAEASGDAFDLVRPTLHDAAQALANLLAR